MVFFAHLFGFFGGFSSTLVHSGYNKNLKICFYEQVVSASAKFLPPLKCCRVTLVVLKEKIKGWKKTLTSTVIQNFLKCCSQMWWDFPSTSLRNGSFGSCFHIHRKSSPGSSSLLVSSSRTPKVPDSMVS